MVGESEQQKERWPNTEPLMQITRQQIAEELRESLADVNEQLPRGSELKWDESASLAPGSSGLDSLAMVNLYAAIETKLEKRFGLALNLAEETEMASGRDPWCNIGTLIDFLTERVAARLGENGGLSGIGRQHR